ncbi:MAG: (4Fe-4S)-binding protein [Alkaliphilus sp.]|jgi:MinD superfamily P-loop ATPase|nr:ATP-binding protein [bacterium AH-315-L21]PHS33845.1 MAG: (4Fe-4S)-binding protein [Alkaliphilus sp.]
MQLVVISGKGGTGKTTIASSFAYLSDSDLIKIDCDVDASNLHLMFDGEDIEKSDFYGAKAAEILSDKCINCNKCIETCRFGAIRFINGRTLIEPLKCEGCGACVLVCEEKAITLDHEITGTTLITKTQNGLISRAEMIPGAEGSGKLVTKVRQNANIIGSNKESDYIIDGSPGVGCAVMASITGCDYCVIVTEPTQSGFEDFKRIYELTTYFGVKGFAIINKYDINPLISDQIKKFCSDVNMPVIGKIPFDKLVGESINAGCPIVSYEQSIAGQSIIKIWNEFKNRTGE